MNLMCHFNTSWGVNDLWVSEIPDILIQLKHLEDDGLIIIERDNITVTELGKPYVRNVCLPFDLRLQRKKPETKLFSMTV